MAVSANFGPRQLPAASADFRLHIYFTIHTTRHVGRGQAAEVHGSLFRLNFGPRAVLASFRFRQLPWGSVDFRRQLYC